jgi:hypothetical protein
MPITIQELDKKYQEEDKGWAFKLFFSWLRKKGIPESIIMPTLKQVLVDFSLETIPEKHHDFDRAVYDLAMKNKEKVDDVATTALEVELQDKLSAYEQDWNVLSKTKKIWEVIRGRA